MENGGLTAGTLKRLYECGDSVTYKCDQGYALHGKSVLTCGESGWNYKFPLCIESKCPPLDEVENAKDPVFTHNGR